METTDIASRRRQAYKKGLDPARARQARADATMAIRKKKQAEAIAKRRRQRTPTSPSTDLVEESKGDAPSTIPIPSLDEVPSVIMRLHSLPDGPDRVHALKSLRRYVASPQASFDALLSAGTQVLDIIFAYVKHPNPEAVCDALWILSNLASTDDHTGIVATKPGFILHVVSVCLKSPSAIIRDQVIWLLGNVAGESGAYRLALAAIPDFGPNLMSYTKELLARPSMAHEELDSLTWLCANMASETNEHPPLFEWAKTWGLPVMETIVFDKGALRAGLGSSTLESVMWCLRHLTFDDTEDSSRVEFLASQAMWMAFIASWLTNPGLMASPSCALPALRLAGNFCSGTTAQTERMIRIDIISIFLQHMAKSSSKAIRTEAAFSLSNIAGDEAFYGHLLADSTLEIITKSFAHGPIEVRLQLCYLFNHIIDFRKGALPTLVEKFRAFNWFKAVVSSMKLPSKSIFYKCLLMVNDLLTLNDELIIDFEEAGIVDLLDEESVKDHPPKTAALLESLMNDYFDDGATIEA